MCRWEGPSGAGYTRYELDPETHELRQAVEYGRANETVEAVHEFDNDRPVLYSHGGRARGCVSTQIHIK